MEKRTAKRAVALTAAFALTVSGITVQKADNAQAASKAPTLSASSISLKKGQTKKIKINANKQKIKQVTWKVDKSKLKITKKTKKYAVVKALKTGSASISVTIVTTKKTYTKKVKAKIKATTKNTPKPKVTKAPDNTTAPNTQPPAESSNPAVSADPGISSVPDKTAAPDETAFPDETTTPDETSAPNETTAPVITSAPGVNRPPVQLIESTGIEAEKLSWGGRKVADFSSMYSGKKVKFYLEVKVTGSEPASADKVKFQAGYNGNYPLLASCDAQEAYNTWKVLEGEYRFGEITDNYPILYFDNLPDTMKIYYRSLSYEVTDQADLMGGTPVAPNEWNMVTIKSLREGSGATPYKYYENKTIHVSFKLREKGLEDPTGKTVNIETNPNGYITLKSNVPLTTDWTNVDFDCTFGEITNTYPSIYFNYNQATAAAEGIEFFIDDIILEVTGEVTPTPTPEATDAPATPAGGDINVPLTAANIYASGSLENEDGTACTPTYEGGSVTFTTSNQYSGGGMAFYLKSDKSAVDLSGYSGVKLVVEGTAGKQLVISPFNAATATNGIFEGKVADADKYESLTGSEQEINIDFETATKWGETSNAYAILVKYNAYGQGDYDGGEKLYANVKIKSITFIAKEAPSTSTGDINVPLTAANIYASGSLENEDGTACTPTYEDGSVTFTTSNQYSGGGMAFYLKSDKSAVDLSGYSGVKLVVEGTAGKQLVISPFNAATATNGIFEGKVADADKYESLTGSEQEINIDFETATKWGETSDAYAILVKYNAYGQGDYDGGEKLYANVKIKSITFIAKE